MDIIETRDLKTVQFITEMIIDEAEIGLIYGAPGTGKTESLKACIRKLKDDKKDVILIEGYDHINILKELSEKLGLDMQKTNDQRFGSIRELLKMLPVPIIIDEAEKISYRGLEWVRRLWDFCKSPTLLCGTETLYENMRGARGQRRQLYRRVRAKWAMQGLSSEEMKEVCDRFGYTAYKNIVKVCGNNFDKAVNILSKMKRFADFGNVGINNIDIKEVSRFIMLD